METKDTKPIEKVIWLIAKTGLFFAHADGKYDVREKNFIKGFIDKLAEIGPVDDIKEKLESSLQHNYKLEDIVSETKDLLAYFNPAEQSVIKLTLTQFVNNVITSDYVENKAESDLFIEWKKALA
ncbi:MAG: hypothetical protein K5856_05620 [Bacteroidaceae bacterium]|nr:hypothetical protein [Bacteroidaceae bacterium]